MRAFVAIAALVRAAGANDAGNAPVRGVVDARSVRAARARRALRVVAGAKYYRPEELSTAWSFSFTVGKPVVPPWLTGYPSATYDIPEALRARFDGCCAYMVGAEVHTDQNREYVHHVHVKNDVIGLFARLPFAPVMTMFESRDKSFSIDLTHATTWRSETHYDNPNRDVDKKTNIRVVVYVATRPRAYALRQYNLVHESGVHGPSHDRKAVPPRSERFYVSSRCVIPENGERRFIFSGTFHAHHAAREMYLVLRRGDKIIEVQSQHNVTYGVTRQDWVAETAVPIETGDELTAACVYSNPTDEPIRFDIGTRSEMCRVQIDWGAAPGADVGSDLCQRSPAATGMLDERRDARDILATRRSGFEGHLSFRNDAPAPARNFESMASAIDAASRDCALRECRLQTPSA